MILADKIIEERKRIGKINGVMRADEWVKKNHFLSNLDFSPRGMI